MPQIRIDVDDREFEAIKAMADRMGAASITAACGQVLTEAAGVPQEIPVIVGDVRKKIDGMEPGREFYTGEILRELYKNTNLIYVQRSGGAVPSTVAARVGRALAAKANMSKHAYCVDRVIARKNVFRKLAAPSNSTTATGDSASGTSTNGRDGESPAESNE